MKRIALLLGLTALLGTSAARAETVVQTAQVRAELTAERPAVAPGESVWVALTLDIKQGWHVYWRTPGDSGQPTSIRWTLPAGVTAGDIQWPVPERILYSDLMSFAYHDRVTHLVEIKTDKTAAPEAMLQADVTWFVCADICIPQDATFSLPLKIDANAPQKNTAAGVAIAAAREQLPKPAPWPVKATRTGDKITLAMGGDVKNAAFFPYQSDLIVNAAPQELRREGDAALLTITAEKDSEKFGEIAGVLAVGEGPARVGYEFATPIVWTAPAQAAADVSLALALLFALAGGLILNLMPCVLPVLTMKALSFARADASTLRRDGLAYTAGVLVAFTALVAVLLGLRATGTAVGWGFQLQSPMFVAVLAYLILVLGLNMSGVFNISGSFSVGDDLTRRGGASGAFFTGLLAVVIGAPCGAPFMGTAIGFTLTQSTATTLLVFWALALGLALPFLIISFVPGAARLLPKPGVWMERLKQVLAFGMYGTAAWLVWVLSQQVGTVGFGAAMAGGVTIAFAAWLWGLAQTSAAKGQRWSLGVAVVMIAATAGFVYALGEEPAKAAAQSEAPGAMASESYSAAKLAALRAEGRPVFVDFTAAWCLTCIVNERTALASADVAAAFKAKNVAYVKADWTNRNAEISAALRALGRDGVPLYAVYLPGGAEAKILPQILTPAIVLEALNGA